MSDDTFHRARAYYAYFHQAEVWVPNGKPPIQITEMDPAWRHNAAQFLVRNAKAYLLSYELGEHISIWHAEAPDVTGHMGSLAPSGAAADMVERELEESAAARAKDPGGWIKTTPLYNALIDGLPDNVAEIAKHWSDCAIRTEAGGCTCWERHLSECPKRSDINEQCLCRDYSPEATL